MAGSGCRSGCQAEGILGGGVDPGHESFSEGHLKQVSDKRKVCMLRQLAQLQGLLGNDLSGLRLVTTEAEREAAVRQKTLGGRGDRVCRVTGNRSVDTHGIPHSLRPTQILSIPTETGIIDLSLSMFVFRQNLY